MKKSVGTNTDEKQKESIAMDVFLKDWKTNGRK